MTADVKQWLQKQYPYRIEMHAHTAPCSPCGKELPEKLVDDYSELGYDALALTNHFAYKRDFDINLHANGKFELKGRR